MLPKTSIIVNSNIAENEAEDGSTYSIYNEAIGYNKGSIVKFNTNIYEALTTIYPLASYIWEDLIQASKYAINLQTKTNLYPSGGILNINVINGVTVVYVRSVNKYYIAKVTATVDFMSENISAPAHFNEVTTIPAPYRYDYDNPFEKENTLFWGYNAVANKYRGYDNAIYSQTTKHNAILTQSISVSACNSAILMNLSGSSIIFTVWDIYDGIQTPTQLYTETKSLIDTSLLDTYEKVCTVPFTQVKNVVFYFQARYNQQIDISLESIGGSPAFGALKTGFLDYLGQTLDKVSFNSKSYNQVSQRPNGEFVWNKDNNEANKSYTLKYNLYSDTAIFDNTLIKLLSMLDKEVVLIGDESDTSRFSSIINYGAIKATDATLETNSDKSPLSIEIENFI